MLRQVLDLAPDALDVARRVQDRPGAVLLLDSDPRRPSYVLCDPLRSCAALDPEPELGLDPARRDGGELPRWIGLLPYEAQRHLERAARSGPDARPSALAAEPRWWRYSGVVVVHERVTVCAEDRASLGHLCGLLARAPVAGGVCARALEPAEAPEVHMRRIARALEYIRRGELYQVNLARRHAFAIDGHPIELLARLAATSPAPYGAALNMPDLGVASTSPELFLRLTPDGTVETSPIKGTRPRGATAEADLELMRALDADPKERAELTMVMDVERNDLGRIARTGTVVVSEPPHVNTYGSIHHRVATIRAQLRPGVSRSELLEAMLPSGSVTGAPKVRAMEVIAELESHRRGLYTGAFGFLTHAGGLELAMAIRTLCTHDGCGEYFAGGGIVADSDPACEVEETRWKAVQLAALLDERP